jgi:UDP-MurNAc hydroxylase
MKIEMIGHATIFVQTQNCRILMDPVLWDPHQEGLFDISPQREMLHEHFPEFDVLIISHQHLDHFDVRSLAWLPKKVRVFFPRDPVIKDTLERLGYESLFPVKDSSEINLGATRLLTTQSENPVPEFGVVFHDESGTFWNQVDTILQPPTIREVQRSFGDVHFLLASWQPMIELHYQKNEHLAFPFSDYGRIMRNIGRVAPKALAPGANGFRYREPAAWLNQLVFPVARERFCFDVQKAFSDIAVLTLDPGDRVVMESGTCTKQANACSYVRTIRPGREDLDFCPVGMDAGLQADAVLTTLEEDTTIQHELQTVLPKLFQDRDLWAEHRHWDVIYQLEIVFPDRRERFWFDFGAAGGRLESGRNPAANLFTLISAHSLAGLISGSLGWDRVQLGGFYRHFHKLYIPNSHGILQPERGGIRDPLETRFPFLNQLQELLAAEISRWRPRTETPQGTADWEPLSA